MSIDVGAVAAVGRDAMASAIRTSGSRVDVLLDPDDLDSTVDFDTLEVTNPTGETAAASNLPALIVAEGSETQEVGRERDSHPIVYRVLLLPTVTAISEGSVLRVRRCLNTRLVDARLSVFEVITDGLNVALTVRARRL